MYTLECNRVYSEPTTNNNNWVEKNRVYKSNFLKSLVSGPND